MMKIQKYAITEKQEFSTKRKFFLLEFMASLLIFMYLYTAISKLLFFEEFVGGLNNQPFDNKYTPILTIVLPTSEIVVSALLFIKRTRKFGFILSTILMSIFTGYIGLVLSRYYGRIPCSCGGVFNNISWKYHLLINIAFLLMSITGTWLYRNSLQAVQKSQPPFTTTKLRT